VLLAKHAAHIIHVKCDETEGEKVMTIELREGTTFSYNGLERVVKLVNGELGVYSATGTYCGDPALYSKLESVCNVRHPQTWQFEPGDTLTYYDEVRVIAEDGESVLNENGRSVDDWKLSDRFFGKDSLADEYRLHGTDFKHAEPVQSPWVDAPKPWFTYQYVDGSYNFPWQELTALPPGAWLVQPEPKLVSGNNWAQDEVWHSQSGKLRVIPISELHSKHLRNILRWIEKRQAPLSVELGQDVVETPLYWALELEALTRDIEWRPVYLDKLSNSDLLAEIERRLAS
jgi:hypothetical protein